MTVTHFQVGSIHGSQVAIKMSLSHQHPFNDSRQCAGVLRDQWFDLVFLKSNLSRSPEKVLRHPLSGEAV